MKCLEKSAGNSYPISKKTNYPFSEGFISWAKHFPSTGGIPDGINGLFMLGVFLIISWLELPIKIKGLRLCQVSII